MYYQDIPVALGSTRDITREGMFVNLRDPGFPKGTALDVEIISGNNGLKHRRLPSVVVHGCPDGLGLMFTSLDEEVYEELWGTE